MNDDVLVCIYEDGTRHERPLSKWTEDNTHDDEAMALLPRLIAGETILMGGGAQPLATVWVETGEAERIFPGHQPEQWGL